MWSDFESGDFAAFAIAQEDKDLETHAKFLAPFGEDGPPFEIVADLNRQQTLAYDRTTAYLIDKQGIVRQVFPMLAHHRTSWHAVLNEVERLGLN